jgi:catechol 2,3-dioxygenase-like lactoylglutathione lyase family enzyme
MLWSPAPSWAQLLAPNEAGVTLGQWHTIVRDVDAAKNFWMLLGGTPIKVDGTEVVKFAGVLVFLTPGQSAGGTEEAVVDHVGFGVPDVRKVIAKLKAAGIKVREPSAKGSPLNGLPVGDVWSPDSVMVELTTVQKLTTPCAIVACIPYLDKWPAAEIASNHVSFAVTPSNRQEMRDWYVKRFGATPGELGDNLVADVPGTRFMRYVTTKTPEIPILATKGRALDYIGFEVKNLQAFCKKLQASGVKLDAPYSKTRHKSFASAELTDPWGTSIELTEGLNRF